MRLVLLFVILLPLGLACQELKVLRLEYPTATIDMHTAEALSKSLSEVSEEDDATLIAYKGALLTLKAKFTRAIRDKKKYFKEGATLLEHAISKAPESIEIRCLRMGVQENAPKLLRYKGDLDEDKQFILNRYPLLKDEGIKAFIQGYVSHSKQFSTAEKQLF
ncbi:hypothetical protein [Maribacter sp. 2307UL18-2]|uniref:hypothetical protein n=1 Tax=Maribacter sp. 2307UL18-2 TaxID=3386274 RepID=UPI0039BD2DFA